jgi:hypothetical protein
MRGNLEAARASIGAARALAEELGLAMLLATGIARTSVQLELFVGDFEAAEAVAASACDALEAAQDWGHFVSQVPLLMDALFPQGRAEELVPKLDLADTYVIEEDLDAQVSLRRARAKLLLSRGDLTGAETLAREAVERCEGKTLVSVKAEALELLASIAQRNGRDAEAAAARDRAIELYEAKGCTAYAERARKHAYAG